MGRHSGHLGAFPVRRNAGDAGSVRTALSLLESGKLLGHFSPRQCVFDAAPFQPKAGVAMLAAKSHADILPACVYCEGRIRPLRVTVRFGPRIPFADLHLENGNKTAIKQASCLIAGEINRLLEEKH